MGAPPFRYALVIAVAAAGALVGCAKPPSHQAMPPGAVVLALGDSLTYGTGATLAMSYPTVLAGISGWRIFNGGIPGETAAQGCARLPDLLDLNRPQLVLVLLGGNDFLRRMPDAGIVDGLRACVRDARSAGAAIVLLTVPRFGGHGLADASLYAEVGRAEGVPVIDSGLSTVLAQRSLREDLVHPNAEGYRRMAERIAEGLRELGYLRRH